MSNNKRVFLKRFNNNSILIDPAPTKVTTGGMKGIIAGQFIYKFNL